MNFHFDPAKFECIQTKAGLAKWIKLCTEAKSFAYDTETTGLDTFAVDLVGHALAVEDKSGTGEVYACYIPTAHRKGRQLDNADVLNALAPLLSSTKPKVLSNALYDMLVLRQPRYDVQLRNPHDIVLQSYVLYGSTVMSHGMDASSERLLGYKPIKFRDVVIEALGRHDFRDVPLDEATAYSAEDTAVTLVLAKVLQKLLIDEGLSDVYQMDRRLLPALCDMKLAGIKIDVAKLQQLDALWEKDCKRIETEAHRIAGEKFSLRSPDQMADVLYTKRGLRVPGYTKGGKRSADKFALEELSGDELVDTLVAYRAKATLRSNFTTTLPGKARNNRVHPEHKITRTSTGRLACAQPNTQQIPTRTEDGARLRECFIASPGMLLVGCDYSQIELRVCAHVTQDPVLLRAYRDGVDIHSLTASTIAHVPVDQVAKEDRNKAKTGNFLTLFGGGAGAFAKQTKVSKAEAYAFIEDHRTALSRLYEWKEEVWEQARRDLYVDTIFGRRVHVPDINSRDGEKSGHDERLAVSGKIQGSAADLMRLAIVAVHDALREQFRGRARLLLSVHDELLCEAEKGIAEKVKEVVKHTMETCADHLVDWSIPIIAEAEVGETWRECK